MPNDDRVDACDYCAVVSDAVASRNGWKVILQRCAPAKRLTLVRSRRVPEALGGQAMG